MSETAFFVRRPRRLEELCKPHLVSEERSYVVMKQAILVAIDYDNFVSDMLADRAFLEDVAGLCAEGEVMKCLLVRRRGQPDGILVIPGTANRSAHVEWAACISRPPHSSR